MSTPVRALNALAEVIRVAQAQGRVTPMGIAVRIDDARLLQSPETAAEHERLRSERDQFADRVDTLTAVAKGNKRHVQELYGDLQREKSEREADRRTWQHDLSRLRETQAEVERLTARVAELEARPSRADVRAEAFREAAAAMDAQGYEDGANLLDSMAAAQVTADGPRVDAAVGALRGVLAPTQDGGDPGAH